MPSSGGPNRSTAVLLLVSMFTIACEAGERTAAWAGQRDTVGGVEVVSNPGQPLIADGRRLATPVWAAANTGPDGLWEAPHRMAVDDERVYVLDLQAHRVFILDAETGTDLGSMGREGRGPGEFQRPFGVGVSEGELWVGNGGGPGWVVFDTDGAYRRSVRFAYRPILFDVLSDGRLLVIGLGGAGRWLLGRDGVVGPLTVADTSIVDATLVFGDCPRYGAGARGILRAQCRRFAFQELAPAGHITREVHVARPPLLASDGELRVHEERLRRAMARSGLSPTELDDFVEHELERARVKGVYNGIRADRRTGWVYLLEQNPPELPSSPAVVHAFDADRRYVAAIPFDHSWEDYRVAGDRLFALARDTATGLVTAVAYDLRFPRWTGPPSP